MAKKVLNFTGFKNLPPCRFKNNSKPKAQILATSKPEGGYAKGRSNVLPAADGKILLLESKPSGIFSNASPVQ